MLFGREPMMLLKGVLSSLLLIGIALGLNIDNEAVLNGLMAVVPVVGGLIAAWKVRAPGRPTAVAAGLVSAVLVGAEAFGFNLSTELKGAVGVVIVNVVAWIARDRVTPEVPGDVPA